MKRLPRLSTASPFGLGTLASLAKQPSPRLSSCPLQPAPPPAYLVIRVVAASMRLTSPASDKNMLPAASIVIHAAEKAVLRAGRPSPVPATATAVLAPPPPSV